MSAYFKHLWKAKKAPSTLWSIFLTLKKTILLEEKQDIGNFLRLLAYLKKLGVGFEPK